MRPQIQQCSLLCSRPGRCEEWLRYPSPAVVAGRICSQTEREETNWAPFPFIQKESGIGRVVTDTIRLKLTPVGLSNKPRRASARLQCNGVLFRPRNYLVAV